MSTKKSHPEERFEELERALNTLRTVASTRVRSHPEGYLLKDRAESLSLRLDLPLIGDLAATGVELSESLDRAISQAIGRLAASRPGCVPCRACDESTCEHAICPGPRFVFVGYRNNGTPHFEDLGQILLDRGDSRVGALYQNPPGFIAQPMSEEELHADLAQELRRGKATARLRGQVIAGWYSIPGPGGGLEKMALSFQLLSSGRKTQLHIVGMGPGEASLRDLTAHLGQAPWDEAARWADAAARTLGPKRRKSKGPDSQGRVEGLLVSLARRLEKSHRGKRRRTHHAESRHDGGKRPTRMAMTDLARAEPSDILFDERNDTTVVLGDRGRTHFFSQAGKIVSSVRYSLEAITRKRDRRIWRPATEKEIGRLKGMGAQSDG